MTTKTQDTTLDDLNEIYADLRVYFKDGFHNLLWQVMVNRAVSRDTGHHSFVALSCGEVGLATKDERGYRPTTCSTVKDYDPESVALLNNAVFGITDREALNIVASSMRGGGVR